MRTYFGLIRDHSLSMSSLRGPALIDYNNTVNSIKNAAVQHNIDTLVSVVRCGGGFQREFSHKPVALVEQLSSYITPGNDTPLFSSVNDLIDQFKRVPDYNNPEVTFIILATSDGQSNTGLRGEQLAMAIRELQSTDRWTFAFRVPRNYGRDLVKLGIEAGNILEWDQTGRGMEVASQANDAAMAEMYSNRANGIRSSKTFYSSMADVTPEEVKAQLKDISSEISLFPVATGDEGKQIRDFVESRLAGKPMAKGAAFYQLIKTEDKIQDYKLIAIRDKTSNAIYCGPIARDMLGLPRHGDARVRPGDHGNFDVFIQSTSVNRKVNSGTHLMYWPNVGVAFKEGKSARRPSL